MVVPSVLFYMTLFCLLGDVGDLVLENAAWSETDAATGVLETGGLNNDASFHDTWYLLKGFTGSALSFIDDRESNTPTDCRRRILFTSADSSPSLALAIK